jgi:hypothetical protein
MARRGNSQSQLEVGSIYRGVVARIESFGAFVNIKEAGNGNERGLVHISQLAKDRVEKASDVVEEEEEVYVKVLSIEDNDGKQKISLSMKFCGQVSFLLFFLSIFNQCNVTSGQASCLCNGFSNSLHVCPLLSPPLYAIGRRHG